MADYCRNFSKTYEVPANTTKQHYGTVQLQKFVDIFGLIKAMPDYAPNCVVESLYPLPMEQMGQV